eukprot:gene29622-35757_t
MIREVGSKHLLDSAAVAESNPKQAELDASPAAVDGEEETDTSREEIQVEGTTLVVVNWALDVLLVMLRNVDLQAAAPEQLPPFFNLPFFNLPQPLTEAALKTAILSAIRDGCNEPKPRIIETFGFECSVAGLGSIVHAADGQAASDWWRYQNEQAMATGYPSGICPIGQLYVPRPRSQGMDRIQMSNFATLVPLFS